MKFSVNSDSLEKKKYSCIITGIFESCCLSNIVEKFDKISNGHISNILQHEEIKGKIGQTLLLHCVPNIMSERILLVGCGKKYELDERKYKKIIKKTINVLRNTGSTEVVFLLTDLHVITRNIYWKIRQVIEIVQEMLYSFDEFKTSNNKACHSLREIIFNITDPYEINSAENAIQHGLAISAGVKIAKDLGNLPPNVCNAAYLASKAHQLSNMFDKNVTTYVINEQQMQALGMHSYLAVGDGSKNESLMSVIKYQGRSSKNMHPIVLIGKGLTFDSGGISIKPSEGMDEMKYDMCGAAAVYGVMQVAANLQLPLNIIGILANCENMPGSRAYRPGDILTTMSGQTVEILNTDAEGRLVLCDVLTYVEQFNPETVIDIATLTGACIIALGNHITGLMSNHNPLANELIVASEQVGDYVWQLPLGDDFQEQLESNFADMTNLGGRQGGAITAGCFLSRFAYKYNWAHLDIAGTSRYPKKDKGATGRPTALLSQFLLNRAGFKDDSKLSIN